MKRHLAEKECSFESPTMTSHLWSFGIFHITLTVFELFAVNSIWRLQRRPLAEKIFCSKARPRLPISVLLTLCVYLEPFWSYSRLFTHYLHESHDLDVR
jgi:hypothetical protein